MGRRECGGSGMPRVTQCFQCDEKAVNYHNDYGGSSLCYCLECYIGYYSDSELDFNQLDLTKDELLFLIWYRLEGE